METLNNAAELEIGDKRTIKEWLRENKRVIATTIVFALFLGFIYFTIWGIRNDRRYFKFDITSIIVGSLFLAAIYLGISIGLNMTYDLIGFANFAHAEYFIIGAYVGVLWSFYFPQDEVVFYHLFLVLLLAFLAAGLIAVIGDIFIFGPLRRKGASNESLMISSIGWGIILRNVVSLYFGGGSLYFRIPQVESAKFPKFKSSFPFIGFAEVQEPFQWPSKLIGSKKGTGFLYIRDSEFFVSYEMIFAISVILFMIIALFYFLEKTKTGTALRATSNNIDLAESSGINTEKMIKLTWFIGGGLAGVAGIIFVLRLPMIPAQGFLFLLPAFAVVVLGGVGSLKGSVLASLIIAFTQVISKSYLIGIEKILEDRNNFRGLVSSYDIILPFVILIGVILVRPYGLYGDEE